MNFYWRPWIGGGACKQDENGPVTGFRLFAAAALAASVLLLLLLLLLVVVVVVVVVLPVFKQTRETVEDAFVCLCHRPIG